MLMLPRYSDIFYLDATSAQTIEADLKRIALAKKVGGNSSDALTWLACQRENWLLVYNNIDDTSLPLRHYFPACLHGNILITTRNRRMINLAQGTEAECHVSEMSDEDAQSLLAKSAGMVGEVDSPGLMLLKVRLPVDSCTDHDSSNSQDCLGARVLCASYRPGRRIHTHPLLYHARVLGHVSRQPRADAGRVRGTPGKGGRL
jgi:hypothetical protein